MYYTLGDIYKWVDYRKVGYIDYCRGDKISKLEIVNMAKELNLHVESGKFWWLDIMTDVMGMKEIEIVGLMVVMAMLEKIYIMD